MSNLRENSIRKKIHALLSILVATRYEIEVASYDHPESDLVVERLFFISVHTETDILLYSGCKISYIYTSPIL